MKQLPVESDRAAADDLPVWFVQSVTDGDSINITDRDELVKVRLACIDAPERSQPFGDRSAEHLNELVESADNRVGFNVVDTDRYGRKVGIIYAHSAPVQVSMVRNGLAYVYERYISNCPIASEVRAAQKEARELGVGVWSLDGAQKPWDYRRSQRGG